MGLPPSAQAFSKVAKEYDRWYEANPLFLSELKALKLLGEFRRPALEVGVGTGQFAHALKLDWGVDPSLEMLLLAKEKGLQVVCALGEALPFKDQTMGALFFLFTFCFLDAPEMALKEAFRVLKPEGQLIIGLINKDSPLGQSYQEKARQGHPLYKWARFYGVYELKDLVEGKGFVLEKAASTLFEAPKEKKRESAIIGIREEAGFLALLFRKID